MKNPLNFLYSFLSHIQQSLHIERLRNTSHLSCGYLKKKNSVFELFCLKVFLWEGALLRHFQRSETPAKENMSVYPTDSGSITCISTFLAVLQYNLAYLLPASALLAVENRVGQLVSMGFSWWAPCQLDEAGGNQRCHDVSGGRRGGPCWTGYTSGAWCYMVSSVRSQWGGRERGQGYVFGLGGGSREGGREGRRDGGIGTQGGAGDSGSVGGDERNITQRRPKKEQVEERERSWNGNDSETKERKKERKQKKKKQQNNNNVTKKDFWRDKKPQK